MVASHLHSELLARSTRRRSKRHDRLCGSQDQRIFWQQQFLFPPLDEQRRLVARIEALAAKIEEARGLRRLAVEEAEALTKSAMRKVFQ